MKKVIVIAVVTLGLIGGGTYALMANDTERQPATVQPAPESTLPPAAEQPLTDEKPQAQTVTVKYSDTGFEPREVTVTKGTTVTFVNNTEIPLWAVTDPHPEHTDYPEFDAARVSEGLPKPGEDFSFTFNKSGTWSYHNHASPDHRGKVTVE